MNTPKAQDSMTASECPKCGLDQQSAEAAAIWKHKANPSKTHCLACNSELSSSASVDTTRAITQRNRQSDPQEHIGTLPAGCGAWDLTVHPIGGDFIRPRTDITLENLRKYTAKAGHYVGECTYPGRKGIRTICSDRIIHIQQVSDTSLAAGTHGEPYLSDIRKEQQMSAK